MVDGLYIMDYELDDVNFPSGDIFASTECESRSFIYFDSIVTKDIYI